MRRRLRGVARPAFGLKLSALVGAIRDRAHHPPRCGLSSAAECRTPSLCGKSRLAGRAEKTGRSARFRPV